MKKILGIIPARYGSTRFPGKPLIDIGGKSMIQRVYEQALKSKSLSKIIVATDDERIATHVKNFGGDVSMTSPDHQSGTDRCAEVLQNEKQHFDAVINIQGDEPFIDPQQIDLLAACFDNEQVKIATLKMKLDREEDIRNPNIVKVVSDFNNNAIYFSRAALPYRRNPSAEINYYKHIGIYGYRTATLFEITKLPIGNLEKAESLEQLRWVENSIHIFVRETNLETLSIDTPDDLKHVEKYLKN
ncbi:MAG: 3-deoxy-manno-octulosonate cytidylyltransferase [Bacteroidota bacterium]